jgi:N-acetylmuramate 1-kinase
MTLQKLHGDASYRTYFRKKEAGGRSIILMQMPSGKASASEEITNLKASPTKPPFLNIAQFLKQAGLPVPEIYEFKEKEAQILLEDLGDITFEKVLAQTTPNQKMAWYKKAIQLLIQFRACKKDSTCLLFERSFDATLYNWEFDHFLEYGIESRAQQKLTTKDKETFTNESQKITDSLLKLPLGPTHRDFQSRNMMVRNEKLWLLDFQDALLGPAQYDLVALLRDSYIELDWATVDSLIDYYLEKCRGKARLAPTSDIKHFKKMFDYVTIQRKLKDAGRFVYIDRKKKNDSFLKHIPVSLRYVKEALERRSELRPLYYFLKKHVLEFK